MVVNSSLKKTLEIEIGRDHNLWKITPLSEKSFTVDKNGHRIMIFNPEISESYDLATKLLETITEEIGKELKNILIGFDPELRIP